DRRNRPAASRERSAEEGNLRPRGADGERRSSQAGCAADGNRASWKHAGFHRFAGLRSHEWLSQEMVCGYRRGGESRTIARRNRDARSRSAAAASPLAAQYRKGELQSGSNYIEAVPGAEGHRLGG